ncbi:MAG: phosphate/phosphite/phosphonate ABC transporter substrate-binding protein [Polyangiales bacterium]
MIGLIVPPSLGGARTNARAELLQTGMSSEIGREVVVRAAETYAELRDAVLSASIELAWAPAAVLAEMQEAHVVLRSVREGHARYHSALIARSDRHVSMATLSGTRAAWVDPLSVGGHLLAVAWLRSQGIEPTLVFEEEKFLGSHRAVVDAVLDGTADLAAVSVPSVEDAQLQKSLAFYAGGAAVALEVVGVTDSAPTDALVITTKLSKAEAERIAQCLLPKKGRSPGFLLTAMEAERLERSELADYRELGSLLWRRKTERPKSR